MLLLKLLLDQNVKIIHLKFNKNFKKHVNLKE
jgi:hypothetical protein